MVGSARAQLTAATTPKRRNQPMRHPIQNPKSKIQNQSTLNFRSTTRQDPPPLWRVKSRRLGRLARDPMSHVTKPEVRRRTTEGGHAKPPGDQTTPHALSNPKSKIENPKSLVPLKSFPTLESCTLAVFTAENRSSTVSQPYRRYTCGRTASAPAAAPRLPPFEHPIILNSPFFHGLRHGLPAPSPKVLTAIDDAAASVLFAPPSPSRWAKPELSGPFHSQPGRRNHAANVPSPQVACRHQFRRWDCAHRVLPDSLPSQNAAGQAGSAERIGGHSPRAPQRSEQPS